jgi:proteasome lid subunit RPN8/RPN11
MDKLKLPKQIAQQIIQYFIDHSPEESCGILAGKNDVVTHNIPITNQAHSPVRYYMEPIELFKALEFIDKEQLSLLAIYHSHPNGPEYPSETDIKEFLYPGVFTIIGFTTGGEWGLKGFIIKGEKFEEVELLLLEKS